MKYQRRSTEWINRDKIIQKHINDRNIENNAQAPKSSTAANNRNTAEVIQGENKLQTGSQPVENKTEYIYNYGLKTKVYVLKNY